MVAAFMSCYTEMIAARKAAIESGKAEATTLMTDTATGHATAQWHIVHHMMLNNPTMYTGISEQQCKLLIQQQVKDTQQKAEIEADMKSAKAERHKAAKQDKLLETQKQREAQQKEADVAVTASDLQAALSKQQASFDAQMAALKKAHPAAKQPKKGTNVKKRPAPAGKGKSVKPKTKGKGKGAQPSAKRLAHLTRSANTEHKPRPFGGWHSLQKKSLQRFGRVRNSLARKSTVLNLSLEPIDAATHSVLSLGPVFRPTPSPLHDSEITTAVRKFAQSIKTSAYFADSVRDDTYDPRLYHPTGNKVDPENPALESTLMHYDTVICKAIQSTTRSLVCAQC